MLFRGEGTGAVSFDDWASRLNGVLTAIVSRLGEGEGNGALVADLERQMADLKRTTVIASNEAETVTDGDAGMSMSEYSAEDKWSGLETRHAAELASAALRAEALENEIAALRTLLEAAGTPTEQL